MVKVKVSTAQRLYGAERFNHPMVKVKVKGCWNQEGRTEVFQPPYGES